MPERITMACAATSQIAAFRQDALGLAVNVSFSVNFLLLLEPTEFRSFARVGPAHNRGRAAEIARNVQQTSAGALEITANIARVSGAASKTGQASGQVLDAAGTVSRRAAVLCGRAVHREDAGGVRGFRRWLRGGSGTDCPGLWDQAGASGR